MKHVLAFAAMLLAFWCASYGTLAVVRCVHAIQHYQNLIRSK